MKKLPQKYPHKSRKHRIFVVKLSPAKGVGLERGARVQISQSAPNAVNNYVYGVFVMSEYSLGF